MNTYNIQLKNNTSFEQYQMAVRVLEAIGVEIEENNKIDDDFFYELSQEDLEAIKIGQEQVKQGLTIKSEDVQKKIRTKYGNKMDI